MNQLFYKEAPGDIDVENRIFTTKLTRQNSLHNNVTKTPQAHASYRRPAAKYMPRRYFKLT